MGTWWKHWGDEGDEERNWPPYLTKLMAQGKCPLYQAFGTPQHMDRVWDLPLPLHENETKQVLP